MRRLTLLILCLLWTAPAWATNYYISPTGSNGVDGLTTSTPWLTFAFSIGSGAGKAGPGDTLTLLDGVYGDGTSTGKISISGLVGTVGNELTIRCLNQRQCRINDNGSGNAIGLFSLTAYIIFDGLVWNSTNNSGAPTTGNGFYANNTDHITIKNSLARNPNKYGNNMPIFFVNSRDQLVEDTEVYDYPRHCVEHFTSQRAVTRRVYCNPRIGAIAGGYANSNGIGRGDAGVSMYPCKDCIEENVIVDGTTARGYLNEMNATGHSVQPSMSGSKVFGSICYLCAGASNGIYPNARTAPGNIYSPTNITLEHNVIYGFTGAASAIRVTSGVNVTIKNNTLLGTASGNGFFGDDSVNGAAVTSFTATKNVVKGFSGTGFTSTGYSSFTGTDNFSNGNGTAFSPAAATWGSGNVTTDPALGTCIAWPPDGSAAATAGVGATILYRYENGTLTTTPLWDPTTGAFPHGATVSGINDVAGNSLFDFHTKINVNTGGCTFPAAFTPPGTPPQNPAGWVSDHGSASVAEPLVIPAGTDFVITDVFLRSNTAGVGNVATVTSSCGSESLAQMTGANAVAATAIDPNSALAYRRASVWYRAAPTAGTCTITVTTSGTVDGIVIIPHVAEGYSAIGNVAVAYGLSERPSTSVVTNTGETVFGALAGKCSYSGAACTTSLTAEVNQTLQIDHAHPTTDIRGAVSTKSGNNGGVMSYVSLNAYWAEVVYAMLPTAPDPPPPTPTIAQVAGQVLSAYLVNGAVVTAGAVNAASTDVRKGVSFIVATQVDCTIADCPQAGRRPYVSHQGGAYVPATDTMTNGIAFHGGTGDPRVVSGPVTTRLSGALTIVNGTTVQSAATTPVYDMTLNSSVVTYWMFTLAADAVVGETYEFREYTDAGVALDSYGATADAKIAVTAAMTAPTGLKLAGASTNTGVEMIWVPHTDPFLLGYKVYRGTAPGVYAATPVFMNTHASAALSFSPLTRYLRTELAAGTFYYAVTAYDFDGNETVVSNEISKTFTGMTPR